ncbi:MAG: ATP-binding cassette domain-containing protein [Acidobacteriota bacterium]
MATNLSPIHPVLRTMSPVMQLSEIEKRFGGIPALRKASLEVLPGEVLGLVGENGAGKSTLINVACGVVAPDAGQLILAGREVTLSGPSRATALGIAVVHQEADLFPQLSVAENMLLGRGLVRSPLGWVDWSGTYREAESMIHAIGESFDVRPEAARLSVARRMLAEIAAAVSQRARVLFLDEPSASLTRREIGHLFEQIRRLQQEGVAVVYVSHRLEEVLEICDRVTILRDGQTIETLATQGLTMDRMVSAMVGRSSSQPYVKRSASPGPVRLRVSEATDSKAAFRSISIEVRGGEILGMYGFVGAGRSELAHALVGLRPLASGTVELDGERVSVRSPRRAVEAGLAYVPEDRLTQGIFRSQSIRANATVTVLRRLSNFGWIRRRGERDLAAHLVKDMRVRASSVEQAVGTLSGGNQQKVVFGRWRATAPKVFILDEPTRGVDVGAKSEIHRLICDMAESGTAVVLISSELPEIMAMCDRIVTLAEGRQTGLFYPEKHSQEEIAAAAVPLSGGNLKEEVVAKDPVADPKGVEASSKAGFPLARRMDGTVGATFAMRLLRSREMGLLSFIALLLAIMALTKPVEFANVRNLYDILANAALPAVMAQGAMLVICAGGIDISIGSMMGLVGATAALAAVAGVPPLGCVLIAMIIGAALGLVNGGVALLARIHPIIVTLAGIGAYRGIMHLITGGREIAQLPAAYRVLADGNWLGVPKVCFYVLGITLLTHAFLRYSLFGRRVLALGNSETAAKVIGLAKTKLTLWVFLLSGALTGFASVLHAGYYGAVQSNTGEGMELKAIAATLIGGTNIQGGRGAAIGTLTGACLVALIHNILILLHVSAYWQNIFIGGLILLAVVADRVLARYSEGPV